MRTKYAFVSLFIVLVLSPLAGMAQEMPRQKTLARIQKMQTIMSVNRGEVPAFEIASESQQLKRGLLRVWDGTEWVDDEETNYAYNGSDPVNEFVSQWNGAEWVPSRKVSYVMGDDQLITSVIHENYAGNGEYVPDERYLMTYGVDLYTGTYIMMYAEYEVWNESEWMKISRDRFLYTGMNFETYPIGWIESYWDGSAWVDESKIETIVSDSDLIQTDYIWSDSWTPISRTVYMNTSMTDYARIASKIEEQAKVYLSLPMIMVELPDFYEQVWDGQIWIFDTRTERDITYDWGTGRILQAKIEILEWDHHLWNPQMSYVIDYDNNEMPFRAGIDFPVEEENSTEEPFRFTEDVFEYDERGFLKAAELRMNYDVELMNVLRNEFEWAGTGTDIGDNHDFPISYHLGNGYPNPFNPSTVIPYETGNAGHVTIRVYDILGRMVATLENGPQSAGKHQVRFDASGLTSGKYLIRMEAPGYSQTRAVTLLK
jgi:hypothetical protein